MAVNGVHCEGKRWESEASTCWAQNAAYWWAEAGIGVLANGCSARGGKGREPVDLRMGSGLSVALGLRRGRGAVPLLTDGCLFPRGASSFDGALGSVLMGKDGVLAVGVASRAALGSGEGCACAVEWLQNGIHRSIGHRTCHRRGEHCRCGGGLR
ncbi:MAG: hypothetical protein HG459_001445 [Bacteroidia bacterium]|nr:hypothetical protein [Bacteroidia bacterium]